MFAKKLLISGLLATLFFSANVYANKAKSTTLPVTGGLKWTGYGVGKSHTGDLSLKDGKIEVKGTELVGGEFTFDMNTITYQNKRLEGHLKSADFFEVEKNPEAKFKITKVEALKDDANGMTHKLTGDLTVKGKTSPIEVLAKITQEKSTWKATGEAEIKDRTTYDIRYNSKKFSTVAKLGDKLIEDNIKIQLDVTTK